MIRNSLSSTWKEWEATTKSFSKSANSMTPFRATSLCDRMQFTYITRDYLLYLKIWMEATSQKLFSIRLINSVAKTSVSILLRKLHLASKTFTKRALYTETSKPIMYSAT